MKTSLPSRIKSVRDAFVADMQKLRDEKALLDEQLSKARSLLEQIQSGAGAATGLKLPGQ